MVKRGGENGEIRQYTTLGNSNNNEQEAREEIGTKVPKKHREEGKYKKRNQRNRQI
jgi:hypothetical protein